MRLLITSYQKSGIHQIYPMFLPDVPNVVDRSYNEMLDMPKYLHLSTEINQSGMKEVVEKLRTFNGKLMGHLTYLPEYAEALQAQPTKVLFNIRDPRDVVIAEYESGLRHLREGRKAKPLWDFVDDRDGKSAFEREDVIAELIVYAAARWPRWLGWLDHDFVLPVKYEDLRLKPIETITSICIWLVPFQCDQISHLAIRAQPKSTNPTFRRGIPGEWKEKFTEKHRKLSEELLTPIIERLGYE